MATDDEDAATLRERVRELEQTVAQQQDTIEQLLPSRRAILAGGAGLVGGAALTGQASAQSAAGQVGTSSEPVDVEAATVSADSVNTDQLSRNGILIQQNSSFGPSVSFVPSTSPDDVSSTSFVNVVSDTDGYGWISGDRIPPGATLYGNFFARAKEVPSGETGTYRPVVWDVVVGGGQNNYSLDELEINFTDGDSGDLKESGWTEITSVDATGFAAITAAGIEAKVTGGTMSSTARRAFALLLEWRID